MVTEFTIIMHDCDCPRCFIKCETISCVESERFRILHWIIVPEEIEGPAKSTKTTEPSLWTMLQAIMNAVALFTVRTINTSTKHLNSINLIGKNIAGRTDIYTQDNGTYQNERILINAFDLRWAIDVNMRPIADSYILLRPIKVVIT